MSAITKLPTTSTPPSTLPSGVVFLFHDNNWNDRNPLWLTTGSYAPGVRHSIAGTDMQDAATWVAFNLPVGQVMTLTDSVNTPPPGSPVWNLSGCGRCIDLVGTGQTESVDLTQVNMNDCVSSFFWRTVDLSQGAIELYDDTNFRGNRNVIFLSEWPANSVISIADWWLNDRVSSVRWAALPALHAVDLFDNADGSGRNVGDLKSDSGSTEIADLNQTEFNDCLSSFRWYTFTPPPPVTPPTAAQVAEGQAIFDKIRKQADAEAKDAEEAMAKFRFLGRLPPI